MGDTDCPRAASFMGVPPEIRLKIYSYLLLSEETVVPLAAGGSLEENILRSHYEAVLFTVNRQISDESLSYFYTQNAFVAVETNMTHFLSECCRAIPMNFGHCKTKFRNYALKLQFFQFTGQSSLRYIRSAFAVFSRRYLRNFIRLFEVNHLPLRQASSDVVTTRMDIIFKPKGAHFKDRPGIISSLVHDLQMLREFPQAVEDHMELTFHSVPIILNVLAESGDIETAKQTRTKGDQFYQSGEYDAARGEYIIALSIVTVPSLINLDENTIDEADLLYVELRSKMSVLDSRQKRYKSAIVEARKAVQLPGDRTFSGLVSSDREAELQARCATTLVDDGQYGKAIEFLVDILLDDPKHPALEAKLAEVQLLQNGHEAH
ncbi:hypothetical protein MMC11_003700 [Xylographa trunciseda]|nr:hypothetical protein [Xylographa trunciseda]